MDVSGRLALVKQVGEEILTEPELGELLKKKKHFVAYDGFEPSGQMHIAQGILRSINVNKMIQAGATFKMLVADWHAQANNKMHGDLEKIQTVGKYLIEVWRAAGMKLDKVEFVWANELVNSREYWQTVMQVARNSTVNRIIRTGEIMGRTDAEVRQVSQLLYPCMQAADIFHLKADVCQLGMDQRKVNVLARELGPAIGFWKPVVVSHHMLMGLGEPGTGVKDPVEKAIAMKMSKSNPDSAIFMTDSAEEVKRKISKAYCPAKTVHENPVAEYFRYIIFERFDSVEIKRKQEHGGNVSLESYGQFSEKYTAGELHPMDVKEAAALHLNELLEPVRKHFSSNAKARKLAEQVRDFKVTR